MSALSEMVDKLDNRRPNTAGYVTGVPELQAILAELSPLVPVGIYLDALQYGDDVSVTIRVGFSLERNQL